METPKFGWVRDEIFEVIDGEREYQDRRWPKPRHSHSITEYLVYIEHYVNLAKTKVSTEDGEASAREDLRKIAALAVAAMEENGFTRRED